MGIWKPDSQIPDSSKYPASLVFGFWMASLVKSWNYPSPFFYNERLFSGDLIFDIGLNFLQCGILSLYYVRDSLDRQLTIWIPKMFGIQIHTVLACPVSLWLLNHWVESNILNWFQQFRMLPIIFGINLSSYIKQLSLYNVCWR